MYTQQQKQQIYKKWIEDGRHWFDHLDVSKEPTYAERQIILEMKKRQVKKSKRDIELEKRTKEIRERYEKKGLIPDTIFDALDNY